MLAAGCSLWKPQLTYDRFDRKSHTYVNDTAGFALQFGPDWRVSTDADMGSRLFDILPLPSATEVSVKAAAHGVGLWVETTKVGPGLELEQLHPAIMRAWGPYLRQYRYTPVSLEKKTANGMEYMEWVYHLRSPDFDRTFMEGLFVTDSYAVRVRAKTETDKFADVQERIRRIMGTFRLVQERWSQATH